MIFSPSLPKVSFKSSQCIFIWTCMFALLTLGHCVHMFEDEGPVASLESALSELLKSQASNSTFDILKSLGVKASTIEIIKSLLQGVLILAVPLVRPVFRFLGMVMVVIQLCGSFLPHLLKDVFPDFPSFSEFLGDVASDLGFGFLAEELQHHNFAGSQYSTTWLSWMHSCQSRALCDIGQFIARAMPLLAPFIDVIGPALGFPSSLLTHIKSGLQTETSCGDIYINCPHMDEFTSRY